MSFDEYFRTNKEFRELVSDPAALKPQIESLLNDIIDEITLGVIFEVHRTYKIKGIDQIREEYNAEKSQLSAAEGNFPSTSTEIYGNDRLKEVITCNCPSCDKRMGASRLGLHLETCMGGGERRMSSRIAQSKTGSYINDSLDDGVDDLGNSNGDDDCERKKRRNTKRRNNGKKRRNTPKKNVTQEMDTGNIDVEGDEDGDLLLMQDNSNQSSPAESVSSTNSSVKKKAKSRRSKFEF